MTRSELTTQAPSGSTGKGSRHDWPRWGVSLAAALAVAIAIGGSAAAQGPVPALSPAPSTRAVTDDTGTLVTITTEPVRVISLAPANTEIVYALGAGDRLVGGTDADDYPPEAAGLPDVASYTGVLMEQVVALDPDLVLAGGNGLTPVADIARMRELGYPVVVVYPASVDAVLDDIQLVGDALGGEAVARVQAITAGMDAAMDRIASLAAATGTTPRTFYELGDQPELYGPAPDSFIADLVELAGGDAITTTDPAVFSIPLEQLIVADPEVILLGDAAYGVCPDVVRARAGWADISAVRTGAIRPVNDTVISRPGPRLAEGLASLARAIHPELLDQLADLPADPPMCATGAPAAPSDQP
jgi:iron complex transport system substrate-binding protein